MKKINVGLYGGIGRTPIEADIIMCDRFNECTLYADKKCLRCRSLSVGSCKYGNNVVKKGYTSRSKKYNVFIAEYRNGEMYNKLDSPSSQTVALIGDYVWLRLKDAVLKKDDNGRYHIETNVGTPSKSSWIEKEAFTVDILYKIFSFSPRDFWGRGIIESYSKAVLPDVIKDLREQLPQLYKEFVTKYPGYDYEPQYVGKYAYVNTMVDGSIIKDFRGNCFVIKNGKLICDKYNSSLLPFDGKDAKIEFEIPPNATCKITDNSQCDENTRFE